MDEEYYIEKLFPSDKRGILIFCNEDNTGARIRTFKLDVDNVLHILIAAIADITAKEKDNINLCIMKALLDGIIQLIDIKKGD